MTAPTEAIARLEMLARGCEVSGLDHLPIVSRDNAAAFAADLRTLLAELAEARKVIAPFDACEDQIGSLADDARVQLWVLDGEGESTGTIMTVADFRRASEFIRRVEGK